MTEFPSANSYWRFQASVRRRWRYVQDETQERFLAAVRATSGSRVEELSAGSPLWRAQEGCDWSDDDVPGDCGPQPFARERMLPRRDRASEGRVNPKGIPCLYAATHQETAVAEVRPWVGAYVSVAELTVLRTLRLVNCTNEPSGPRFYVGDDSALDAAERERACWRAIDHAFARPVSRHDEFAEYAPTQILAEVLRQEGFDGIGYRSALGPGHNIAIFDLAAADVRSCGIVEVRRVSLEYEQANNPYFVSKYAQVSRTPTDVADEPSS